MGTPPAVLGAPALTIRGTRYPVLLPKLRDPRLHLAAVITSLQVLGQVAFDFNLSIAQILVSLLTAGVLEFVIAFRGQRVLMWPASALLTGNGVAFVLRVPGTEHGDWWSMNGWWIFAVTSAVALLSKYVIRVRGSHVFNPSNFGLVLAFVLLGSSRADPLALWWGPLSPALVLALAIIMAGGFAILRRLHLLEVAVAFWVTFAAGIAVLAASGHTMTAAWHVGPIEGREFWWLLVSSPEILVFLFFMITDPKTIPASHAGRRAYAVSVGLLATLLIAPQTTEFGTKVAILGSLFLACATRGVLELVGGERLARIAPRRPRRALVGTVALTGAVVYGGLVVAAGIPARPEAGSAAARDGVQALPAITVAESPGVAPIDEATAQSIARDIVVDLRIEEEAVERGDLDRAADAASGEWLATLWQRIRSGGPTDVPAYDVQRMQLSLHRSAYQGPPTVVARLEAAGAPSRTVELALERDRYRIVHSKGGSPVEVAARPGENQAGTLGGVTFTDVARDVGLTFRHGAFRFEKSFDTTAMMGGGVCWLDFDGDGWLDLFAVNSHSQADGSAWEARGGLPRTALYHNVRGRFEDVSLSAGADLPVRGNGCVAADFDLDGDADLYVTTAGYNVPTDGYDALLWNDGDGTFTEGARAAGINAPGWHAGAAVGDVNADGLPDLVVTGYTDPNWPLPASAAGFPTNHHAERDLLYLNQGKNEKGGMTFREVGKAAGLEAGRLGHGLGAELIDLDLDGLLELYVANDTDPNQLYESVPWPGGAAKDPAGLGFRFREVGRREGVDDPNAGMGIAAADFDLDGRADLLVTNSRGQLHAAYRSSGKPGRPFVDARQELSAAFGTGSTGWGASWADLDLDGDLDVAVANGAIPVRNLAKDARRVRVLENRGAAGFAPADRAARTTRSPRVNGRGLAAADYDNDGDVDLAVNSIGGRLLLLENRGARGHWLEVRLPTFTPGAVVTAVLPNGRRLVRQVVAGSSYLSSEDPRVHFGLGAATKVAELRVRYPDGTIVRRRNLDVDRIVDVG